MHEQLVPHAAIVRRVQDKLHDHLQRRIALTDVVIDFSDEPGTYIVEFLPSRQRFAFDANADTIEETP
jgi:hypothetical protein